MFRLLFVTFFGEYRGDVDPAIRHARRGARRPAYRRGVTPRPVDHERAGRDSDRADRRDRCGADVRRRELALGALLRAAVRRLRTAAARARDFRDRDVGASCCWSVPARSSRSRGSATRPRARKPTPWSGCATRSLRMPAVLTNLFYFDALIDLVFVRPAQLLGTLVGRVLDPHVIDGAVRELAEVGALARDARAIGRDRSRARLRLDLGVRRGLLHRLLRAGGGRVALMLVVAAILCAVRRGLRAVRSAARRSQRARGSSERRLRGRLLPGARGRQPSGASAGSRVRSSRRFTSGRRPFRSGSRCLLALCTACAVAAIGLPRTRGFVALMLLARRRDARAIPGARLAAVCALLGSDADPGVLRD